MHRRMRPPAADCRRTYGRKVSFWASYSSPAHLDAHTTHTIKERQGGPVYDGRSRCKGTIVPLGSISSSALFDEGVGSGYVGARVMAALVPLSTDTAVGI